MAEPIVLVVDDEANVVRLCRRLLERANFQVVSATDASQALEILDQQAVDLLLVDIRMPGMDGFQLLSLARRRQAELAVVIMTGFGTLDTAIAALEKGADGLILKPFAGAELVQNVQRALQENQHKRDILRLQALRPLFDFTETLFTETDPDRLVELILKAICGHLHCSFAYLYQQLEMAQLLMPLACRGEVAPGETDGLPEGLIRCLLAKGMPLCVQRDGPGEAGLQTLLADSQIGSLMCAPINHKSGSLVFVAVRSPESPVFRDSDLEMFVILSRQASAALENARLYGELRSYIQQVERSQQAMIQAERMAAAGRLTASIAHEINNPLQAVNNCLHLAGRKELRLKTQQKYLGLAQAELDRLMSTVQRMLEFYRPGVRDRKLTDVHGLVNRVLMLLETQLEENGISVQTNLAPQLPLVMLVASQIQQVLLNLIINSMEAMPGGGKIYIQTKVCPVKNRGAGLSGIEILIEDNGPGVPAEERELIFEPFLSSKENGTGLGLAVSYGIIAAHGGTLELVEGRGKGACFRIFLPEEENYEG